MTIEELNSSKVPIIVFDKKLEQFRDKVLFPQKLKKANELLSKGGLPQRKNKLIANKSVAKSGAEQSGLMFHGD